MKYYTVFILLFFINSLAVGNNNFSIHDSLLVDSLNKEGSRLKFSNPKKGIEFVKRSFDLAGKIKYENGKAESHRIRGIIYSYLVEKDSCIKYYFLALNQFKKNNNQEGIARVSNNLGNLYSDYNFSKSIYYYNNSLKIAQKLKLKDLVAGYYMNVGTLYNKRTEYQKALLHLLKALPVFKELKNDIGIIMTLENIGSTEYYLKNYKKAEKFSLESYRLAKKINLNSSLGVTCATLSYIYLSLNDYLNTEKYILEGSKIAGELENSSLIYDFQVLKYELEKKRLNYKLALKHLEDVYKLDSISFQENIKNIINLNEEQIKNAEIQKQYEVGLERQKNNRILFMAAIIVSALSAIIIFILIRSKRKTEQSNQELIALNKEVIRQKEDLDRVNLKLEEIIAERTKDLLSKNQKLSEYSYHLSHQVRGPVATLKGLIMLSQDNLIEEKECIVQMKKCVDDIDEQIMDINIALHDPSRHGLKNPNQDSGNL
jgi:tetratricopeptide (TPR) repeat protein